MTRPDLRQKKGRINSVKTRVIEKYGLGYWNKEETVITERLGGGVKSIAKPIENTAWWRRKLDRIEKREKLIRMINVCVDSLRGEGLSLSYIAGQMGMGRSTLWHYRRGEVFRFTLLRSVLAACQRLIV